MYIPTKLFDVASEMLQLLHQSRVTCTELHDLMQVLPEQFGDNTSRMKKIKVLVFGKKRKRCLSGISKQDFFFVFPFCPSSSFMFVFQRQFLAPTRSPLLTPFSPLSGFSYGPLAVHGMVVVLF